MMLNEGVAAPVFASSIGYRSEIPGRFLPNERSSRVMRSKGPVFLVRFQLILLRMQSFESCFSVRGEVGSTHWCHRAREESRLPFLGGSLPLCSFLSLLLFNLCLQIRRMGVLFAHYGIGDVIPELEGLVGQLLFEWRHNFGDGVQRVKVDDENLLLPEVSIILAPLGSRSDLRRPC
jgi:hypothetical protein